jgi:hypothetical protein
MTMTALQKYVGNYSWNSQPYFPNVLGQPRFVQLEAEACQGWRGEIRLNNHICQVVICLTARAFELIHFENMNAG